MHVPHRAALSPRVLFWRTGGPGQLRALSNAQGSTGGRRDEMSKQLPTNLVAFALHFYLCIWFQS